jgi:glycosyltransferase involved in cell wall biosynthesis
VGLSANRGSLGLVRNVGIRLTRSTYLAFLDDDNTWYPHHLAASLAAHRDGAELTYTALERVRPDGSALDVLSVPFDRGALWDRKYTDANSLVVRRTPAVRFSRHRDQAEDWELVLRLSRSMRVEHVPTATVRYLMNDRSYYHDYAELGGSGVHRTTRG